MASAAPPPLLTLTDELLEEIFLRLPTPTALALACIACSSFHRIITDRSFLRRFRALQPPPLLGFIDNEFHAAEAPHPSAPLACALARAADFSYSFVPAGRWLTPWHPRDVRQGRVLLECFPENRLDYDDAWFPTNLDLAVCDPLYQLYVLLPPIPVELKSGYADLKGFELFLAPTGEDEEETSFKVVRTAWSTTGLVAFVFSSITAQWHIAASPSWRSLGTIIPSDAWSFSWFYYAWGCCYWTLSSRHKLLVLDMLRMEFSIVNFSLPSYVNPDNDRPRIVVDREGSPQLLFFGNYIKDGVADLFRIVETDGELSDKWQLENIVPLPLTEWRTVCVALGTAGGFLFLQRIQMFSKSAECSSEESLDLGCFSLDVKTSELKKICGTAQPFFRAHLYFGFPPSLSKPCL
ncbi:hypothetical protein U9M48_015562 [Paspalum notatum var. saurae]|uniref:F-box domain-containing protein n=1 Tax=Paspalum notatum var. saurae TaxID=547442 RepID=A0AAQ3T536_PASNO